jgi:hypothetical protein
MTSASRVLAIYDKALAFRLADAKDGHHVHFNELWGEIFGIQTRHGQPDEER